MMPLSAGTRLGRYEIRSQLGAGGMGEVYLARDTTELERAVAVKVLSAELAADPERMRRFVQEAQTASSLNHPNILTVYEIGQANDTRFIATEYVEGETLRQRMERSRLTLREVLDIAIQIASALVAAHKAGVVHRDIKPENMMVREDAIVKVLDFGLAKPTGRPSEQPSFDSEAATRALINTSPGTVMGTVAYMSPEQARGLSVDKRTDIWSLGVVLYEMIAGRVPFAGETTSDVIAQVLTKEPPALTLVSSEATDHLDDLVQKALVKDREERYQHVKDLLIDLKRLKQRLDVEAEIERTQSPEASDAEAATTNGARVGEMAQTKAARVADVGTQTASSAEYIVTEIKRHKRGAFVLLVVLLAAMVTVVYFAYAHYFAANDKAGGNAPVAEAAINSIAVLPFANVGGNPDTEYLSDGISESLINSLSQLPQLKVIARSSSFKYRGKDADPEEAARALGVGAILTGRVTQRGENLLISVELMNARNRTQVWGEQYNRKATDLLVVQSEISREIAEKLRLRLSTGEQQQLAKRETANPEAYELMLKGRFYYRKGGIGSGKKAVEYYRQAISVDPTYALAYAELAAIYNTLVGSGFLNPKEFRPKEEEAARRALELDERLAEAHLAVALLKTDAWEWAAAEREYQRAIELNPNLSTVHRQYSLHLTLMGRHDQAIAEIKSAREMDPLSPIVNANLGNRLYFARQYDQAIEVLKKMLELDQNFGFTHLNLGYAYSAKGMYPQAIEEFQKSMSIDGENTSDQIFMGYALAQSGKRREAQAILEKLKKTTEYVSPAELAVLYIGLGDKEGAIASLEKAYAARDLQLEFLKVDQHYDSLHTDPRFQDLMRRVGLPQ